MKIFISYTLKDQELTDDDFQNILTNLQQHEVFIHYFNKNIDTQCKVNSILINSDIVLVIKTKKTFNSVWVLQEIKLAQQIKLPIFIIDINDLRKTVN